MRFLDRSRHEYVMGCSIYGAGLTDLGKKEVSARAQEPAYLTSYSDVALFVGSSQQQPVVACQR